MDRRVLNVSYSKPPVTMFMVLASIMDEEELQPSPPVVAPNRCDVIQQYGSCPAQVGCDVYYRLSQGGHHVHLYDPEADLQAEDIPGEWWEWKDEKATVSLSLANFRAELLRYLHNGK